MKRFLLTFCSALFAVAQLSAADLTVTPANVIASVNATKVNAVANAAITAGELVYRADGGAVSGAMSTDDDPDNRVIGVALNSAASGQPVVVCTNDPELTLGATVASGAILILSSTVAAGHFAPVADAASGDHVSVVGVGIGSNKINFHIIRSEVEKP